MTGARDKEHSARVLGYLDRLAKRDFVIPAEWSDAERKAYQAGVIAAERDEQPPQRRRA
jgi:hypothetical protein